MKFPPGNRIKYGQDHGWHVGVPSDVDFEAGKLEEFGLWLRAPGYGGEPYGNGKIVVYFATDCGEVESEKLRGLMRQATPWFEAGMKQGLEIHECSACHAKNEAAAHFANCAWVEALKEGC